MTAASAAPRWSECPREACKQNRVCLDTNNCPTFDKSTFAESEKTQSQTAPHEGLTGVEIAMIRACLDDGSYTKQERKDIGLLCDMALRSLAPQASDGQGASAQSAQAAKPALTETVRPSVGVPSESEVHPSPQGAAGDDRLDDMRHALELDRQEAQSAAGAQAAVMHLARDGASISHKDWLASDDRTKEWYLTPLYARPAPPAVTDEMVSRFLAWKLPTDFSPDAGISFKPEYNQNTPYPARHEPIGTNLLTADQARAMLVHVLSVPAVPEGMVMVPMDRMQCFRTWFEAAADSGIQAIYPHGEDTPNRKMLRELVKEIDLMLSAAPRAKEGA